MSIWTDIHRRSNGQQMRKEDAVEKAEKAELDAMIEGLGKNLDQFLIKAKEAFLENDRYTCAIFYTLYALALNKDILVDAFSSSADFLSEFFTQTTMSTTISATNRPPTM